jgi:hypothetical protein
VSVGLVALAIVLRSTFEVTQDTILHHVHVGGYVCWVEQLVVESRRRGPFPAPTGARSKAAKVAVVYVSPTGDMEGSVCILVCCVTAHGGPICEHLSATFAGPGTGNALRTG